MDWLAHKYIGILSHRFRNFKRKGPNMYNFSCPICGDSAKDPRKARGCIYEKKGTLLYHCHNCSISLTVPNFVKAVDHNLYDEYVLEKLRDEKPPEQKEFDDFVLKMKPPVFRNSGPLKGLKKISQLDADDPLKKFVVSRNIPNEYHAKLFACPNFMRYVNTILPNKFSAAALARDETRLLIPFLDHNKTIHAFQGRSLSAGSKVKYITIVLRDDVPKVYGLDTCDRNKRILVVEGPIDSMFLNNSIATAGGDLVSSVRDFERDKLVIVYDNEPRSPDTIKKIDKAIINGYSVCIWPENLVHKDINDMVNAGMSKDFISHIIKDNTYRDLAAKLKLQTWSKI